MRKNKTTVALSASAAACCHGGAVGPGLVGPGAIGHVGRPRDARAPPELAAQGARQREDLPAARAAADAQAGPAAALLPGGGAGEAGK
eukprot:6428282-Prymnesium_polylepis.1